MKAFYTYDNYRKLLKDFCESRKSAYGSSFNFARLAERIKIQRTYLSAVINGRSHLNSDQLFCAMQFLNLKEDERNFLELLHQRDTSTNPERRTILQDKIDGFRAERMKAKNFVRSQKVYGSQEISPDSVFLNVDAQIVHVFLTIEKYRRAPEKIRSQLQMQEDAFNHVLGILVNARLIEMSNEGIRVLSDDLHLSSESTILHLFKILTRQRVLQRIQSDPLNRNFGFSAVFSAGKGAQTILQQNFLQFVETCKSITKDTDGEEVLQINFDLIPWS